ncbi:MFS transporter [Streptomyces sp. S465]|uniref:MFS transporter n=1 Tax=Streptomyces sp. S465 TaxID=2979468 RepID=UPI0022A88538|nr:MFS transporter [Streptomyces sp. S465]WAP58501.1 MFS transporter [Streptomyces sp. S465]
MTTSTPPSPATGRRAGRKEWTAFVVLMLPLLLVSMDVSVLYFAVPAISRELHPSATQQLWLFDIYAFALAGLLITMGALGDRFGRRKLLMFGAAAFGAASVAAAYAPSAEMLIAARAVLGIGGATLMPSTMALVRNLFLDEKQRAKAIAIWSSAMAGGVALGSVLSGVMIEHFWWGSVFLINVPAMVLLLVLVPLLVPEFKDPKPGAFDLAGVPLSMAAVLPVIYGLKKTAADNGAGPIPVLAIVAGLAIGAVFVRRQLTRRDAMISPELFHHRGFGPSIALNALATFAMMGSAYFTTQYLQSVLGKGPLEAALWSLAPSVCVGIAGPAAAALVQRGANRAHVIGAGFLTGAIGYGILALAGTDALRTVLIGAAVLASGIVMVMSLVTDMAIGTVPPKRAGSAAALLETGQEFGGAMGMAVLGSVGTAVYRSEVHDSAAGTGSLPTDALDQVRETLGAAIAVAGRLKGQAGTELLDAAREAFTHGMRLACAAGAVVLVATAVLALMTLRGVGPTADEAADDAVSTGAGGTADRAGTAGHGGAMGHHGGAAHTAAPETVPGR